MLLKPARHREASAETDGQCGDFNAQYLMNCFPKVAKIARKRLFTSESKIEWLTDDFFDFHVKEILSMCWFQ